MATERRTPVTNGCLTHGKQQWRFLLGGAGTLRSAQRHELDRWFESTRSRHLMF
jgi:hypothetical protein